MIVFWAVVMFLVCIVLQGVFAGYETGFVSSNPIRIRYLAEEAHLGKAARLLRYMYKPEQMLTTLLIGTNVAVIAGTMAITTAVGEREGIAVLIATPVFLVFSEIIPKSVFRAHSNRLTLYFLPLIQVFYLALTPVSLPISWVTGLLLRAAGAEKHHISPFMSSLEDVRVLVDESAAHGSIEREEQRMIHSVIDLSSTTAKEIMVPRIGIQALPDSSTRRELLTTFEQSGRTRIPIYKGTIDEIVGVVNAYDVLMDTEPDREDIARFIRETMHVPDTINLDDLFKMLKKAKQHLVIVTDEYGGTDGLITMEDILEEIFGEIQDEHDHEENPIHQISQNAYVIDARTPLEEVSLALALGIADEEVETVGGWLMRVAGRIPLQGEVIEHGRFRVTVLASGTNFVSKIRLEVKPETRRVDDDKTQP
ncbi:MAG: HlyC/CorC family transporter [Candidatus Hydrogenedentes bacterium]|nr:HlyC/CorC family transporter [Candidatus Hydrogenedentota bacterium]